MRATSENGQHRGFGFDPYLVPLRQAALEPRRLIVELSPDEFERLDRALPGALAPAAFLRLVALRLLAEVEPEPPRRRRRSRSARTATPLPPV